MPLPKQHQDYTTEYIYSLPDGQRAELIDGQVYMMAPPSRKHQRITVELSTVINNFIKSRNGSCEVDIAPFAVFLNQDDKNYVEPDIAVICDQNKLTEKGCNGALTGSLKLSHQAVGEWTTISNYSNIVLLASGNTGLLTVIRIGSRFIILNLKTL